MNAVDVGVVLTSPITGSCPGPACDCFVCILLIAVGMAQFTMELKQRTVQIFREEGNLLKRMQELRNKGVGGGRGGDVDLPMSAFASGGFGSVSRGRQGSQSGSDDEDEESE